MRGGSGVETKSANEGPEFNLSLNDVDFLEFGDLDLEEGFVDVARGVGSEVVARHRRENCDREVRAGVAAKRQRARGTDEAIAIRGMRRRGALEVEGLF